MLFFTLAGIYSSDRAYLPSGRLTRRICKCSLTAYSLPSLIVCPAFSSATVRSMNIDHRPTLLFGILRRLAARMMEGLENSFNGKRHP
jgi:hypothetical protein